MFGADAADEIESRVDLCESPHRRRSRLVVEPVASAEVREDVDNPLDGTVILQTFESRFERFRRIA